MPEFDVVKVFGPEHGFRGNASNGEQLADSHDPVNRDSYYFTYMEKNQYPPEKILQDVDLIVFDIQDVGARFFTYIITLQRVMQSCAEF